MNNQLTNLTKLNGLFKLLKSLKGFSVDHINNINFICSLAVLSNNKSLNKLPVDKTIDVLYSSKLVIDNIDLEKIATSLFRNSSYIKSDVISVYLVSSDSLNTIYDDSKVITRTSFLLDNDCKTKINLEHCNFIYFISNISYYLSSILELKSTATTTSDAPIFIFQGLHLSTLISVFKQAGYTLHGGSMTLRHKLSSLEYNLAIFLYITELDYLNKKLFYYTYVDSFLSNNSVDKSLYEFFKEFGYERDIENSLCRNHPVLTRWEKYPEIFIYILRTLYFKLLADYNLLDTKNKSLISEIKSLDNRLNIEDNNESPYNIDTYPIGRIDKLISILREELKSIEGNPRSSGHVRNKRNKIKTLKKERDFLIKENSDLLVRFEKEKKLIEIKKLEQIELEQDLQNLNDNIEELKDKVISTKSLSLSSSNYKKIKKSKDFSKREFSTSINYSKNKNLINNKISIRSIATLNSPIKDKILEILYSNKTNVCIQRDLENFLMNEQNILTTSKDETNLSLNLPVNYPLELKEIISEAKNNIITLHKNYLKEQKSKFEIFDSSNNKEKLKYNILSSVTIKDIINNLFTIFFKILNNADTLNKQTYVTENFYSLGKVITQKYIFNKYEKLIKDKNLILSFNSYKKEYANEFDILEDNEILVQLGSLLLGWLITCKLLESKVGTSETKEKRRYLIPGKNIKKHISNEIKITPYNLPVKFPMVSAPKKYLNEKGEIQLGGYLLNNESYIEDLFIENTELVRPPKVNKENIIYQMVDNLNSVSFTINNEVLDFIINNNEKLNLFTDPNKFHPLEKKEKLTIREQKELESFKSIKNLELEILNIALILRNNSEIFMPVQLDYRGRVYCTTTFLNYQGIELAKALLVFSKAELVDLNNDNLSIEYLKIYGANCFGLDKKSFQERIEWVDNNEQEILNFKNGNLISKAENKLLFIAFCFEYIKYINAFKNNKPFYTNLPIQLDATCNGFQHLSLLLKDISLANLVNIGNTNDWKDKPEDFYSYLALKCKEFLDKELKLNSSLTLEEKDSYLRLSKVGFHNNRSLVKKTIMTIPYNATIFANVENMRNDFNYDKVNDTYIYKKDSNVILKYDDFFILCKTLYKCLYFDFPRLNALLNYFNKIASVSNKLNLHIPWNLPSGLEIEQRFYSYNKIKFKPFLFTNDLLTINILDKKNFNDRKQRSALMPNLVHSLDASSLAMLVHRFFNISEKYNFFAVHDCFAVTCNNVHLIVKFLKFIYCEIYCSKDFLINFDNNFRTLIKITYPGAFIDNFNIKLLNKQGKYVKIIYPEIPTSIIDEKGLEEQINKSSYLVK